MTTAPLTRGPREVREILMSALSERVPPALAASRAAWGLTPQQMPDPQKYERYEPLALDLLPTLACTLTRANDYAMRDLGPGGEEEYEARYAVRLFAWLKDQNANPTQQLRDDYATTIAGVLLATPSLGSGGTVRVVETSLEVSYSDVTKVKGDRWVAGVSLAFDLLHRETLRRVALGAGNTVVVEATVLSED